MQSEDSRIQIVQANCLFKVMGQELVNMTEPRKQQSIYVSAFISIQFSIKFRTFITTAGIRTAFDQTWAHVTHFSIQYRHLFQFKMVTIREWTWPRGFLTTFGKIQVNEKKNQRLWVFRILDPRREAGDVWCLPPVWNLRAVIWFHFSISSLVLLASPVTLSVLSFSACWPFLLNFFQKILQYFSLRDRLFCMAPV